MRKMKEIAVLAGVAVAVVAFGLETDTKASDSPMFFDLRQMGSEATQVSPEKQAEFEEHLAQKRAEFQRNMDKVKAGNDEMRRKFDEL